MEKKNDDRVLNLWATVPLRVVSTSHFMTIHFFALCNLENKKVFK